MLLGVDEPFKVLQRINNNDYKIDNPLNKYSVSDTLHVFDLVPFHGDEVLDPRTDLPQREEGGDGVEQPMDITVDTTTTPQAPIEPMTGAHARTIEYEVNSSSNFLCIHSRQGYYFNPRPYAYSSTKDPSMKDGRKKATPWRRRGRNDAQLQRPDHPATNPNCPT